MSAISTSACSCSLALQPHLGVGLLGHLLHQIPRLPVEGHQRKLPRQSDCRNLLPKVGWELGVVLRGPLGGDVDVVPAEAENGVPPGWGEGVPLAEESVDFSLTNSGSPSSPNNASSWRKS